jgi:large subunit ribosomal protein L18
MAAQKIKKSVLYRRKREGRTNYKKRLLLLKSRKLRLIIRKTNTQIILQLAQYMPDGDRILCGVSSSSLAKLGWKYSCKNLPACYLAGLMLGKKALAKKLKEAILDVGLQTPVAGSKIYAALKGVIDAGMEIPASEDVFPAPERLLGKSISAFFSSSKNPVQFADYKKKGADPGKLQQDIDDCKKKIMSG